MQPRIELISEKKLIGKKRRMSLQDNQTALLWQSFMPHRKEIRNNKSTELYSVQDYPTSYDFAVVDTKQSFDKWATIEVTNFDHLPQDMETYVIPEGLYAIFHYTGSSNDHHIFEYIFATWLPNSPYVIDQRPHFEVLGENYKNNDPTSEEDIYIPIKMNTQ